MHVVCVFEYSICMPLRMKNKKLLCCQLVIKLSCQVSGRKTIRVPSEKCCHTYNIILIHCTYAYARANK